jgi:putative transposase
LKLEPLATDNIYHIYNRGINGENIFATAENKSYFLKLLDKHLGNSISVLVFCLMDNHFHLLLKIEADGDIVTQNLSNLFNAYAKAFNKATNRTGSLFEKHFKRIKVNDENYLRQLVVYIHLNPKHHFDLDFTKFKYSSYNAFLSDKETKIDRGEILKLFEDRENFIYVHHQKKELLDEKLTLE